MSDVQTRVVEVLAEHRMKYGNVCTCKWSAEAQKVAGKSGTLGDLHRAHVAAVLTEAGLLEVHPGDFVRVETAEKYRSERDAARKQEASQTRAAVTAWAVANRLRDELAEAKAEGALQVYAAVEAEADTWGEPKVAAVVAAAREAVARIEKEAR